MAYPGWNFEIGDNNGGIPFDGVMANVKVPIWTLNNGTNPANLEVSTLTVNSYPAGNILLTHNVSSGIEFNAPLIFQRPATDINQPVESLQMVRSVAVPTKPIDGEYIAALKDNGTVYDDIAVAGLQIFGNQTIGSHACGYITCDGPNVTVNTGDGSLYTSSLIVSSLFAQTVVSTTTGTANSYTATQYLSTPVLYTNTVQATGNVQAANISSYTISTGTINANNISTNYISTNDGYCSSLTVKTANISTAQISSLVAGQFGASRIDVTLLSSLTGDITFNLVSTLSLFGNVDVNLGLGNQIAGLIGGAASQGLGVGLGGAALVTGATALVTGRTSGGVDPTVFQTVNGSTQLQFSTIGTATTNVFATTNSTDPLHTPGSTIYISSVVPAGSYCVRSVGDPLNIQNNASSIQMFGQWVPLIQNSPTLPSFTISTLNASTIGALTGNISSLIVSSIGGSVRMSTILTSGNILSQNPSATFVWGSPGYQTILSQTSTVMGNARAGTLTVLGDTFAQQVFGLSGNFNTVTASNQMNTSFVTGSNWISTPQLTVSTINGLTFPTPIPSTLSASTINMTGNLIGLNAAGYITWPTNSGAPYSSTIIQAPGITTNNISTQTATLSSLNLVGNINTLNPLATANFITVNISTLAASTINASAINTSSITSKGGSISTINISTINGVAYPPPNFGVALPSTLYLSTVIQNGNYTQTNPLAFSAWPVTGGNPGYTSTIIKANGPNLLTNQFEASLGYVQTLRVSALSFDTSLGALNGAGASFCNVFASAVTTSGLNVNQIANMSSINATGSFVGPSISTIAISSGQIRASILTLDNLNTSSISSFNASGNLTGGSNGTFYWGQTGVEQAYISTLNISGSNETTAVFPYLVSRFNFRNNGDAQIGSNLVVGGTVEIGAALTCSNSASFTGDITSAGVITGRVLAATQTLTAPPFTTGNLNVQQIANISTGVVSSLFTQFINNLPYPPQGPSVNATPSTMYASTVYIDGGLIVRGGDTNFINTVNISSLSSVSVKGLLTASTLVTTAGITNTGGLPVITSNLSAVNINNVQFINGQIYPPPSGSTSIPSTLYASTLLVNGGQTISGPPLTFFNTSLNQTGGSITTTTGLMQMSINPTAGAGFAITAGSNLLSTLMFVQADGRSRFTSSMTVRDNIPPGVPSQAYIQTYITGSEAPAGTIYTSNVNAQLATIPSISTINISASNVYVANSITTPVMNTSSIINLSSINGSIFPPAPSPYLVPTGSITIWAGGSDNGSVQNFAVPTGWLACDGRLVLVGAYTDLYTVIGNKYDRGQTHDGLHFFLPDLTFTVPMGTPFRNYAKTLDLTQTTFVVTFQTWTSSYVTNPAIQSCWKISQTSGGTLNFGTLFPATGFSSGTWPAVYVSQILQYDGYSGYIIVTSADGVSAIPTVNADITAEGNGVIDQVESDYIYTLGTYGVKQRPTVTHNQTTLEVATHNHPASTDGSGSLATGTAQIAAANGYSAITPLGIPYGQSTISSITTGPTGYSTFTNIGTYTAPNFLNLLYIIKY